MTSRLARIALAASAAGLAVVMAAPSAMAYPPNPTTPEVVAPGVVVVSQVVANNATPRKLLQPPANTISDGQRVRVQRGAVVAMVVTGLQPRTSYRVSIRVDGSWERIGTSVSDANGVAQAPAVRIAVRGTYPMRFASGDDPDSPYFFSLVVR